MCYSVEPVNRTVTSMSAVKMQSSMCYSVEPVNRTVTSMSAVKMQASMCYSVESAVSISLFLVGLLRFIHLFINM